MVVSKRSSAQPEGNFAVMNALKAEGAAFYSSHHECGAVMMADGYAAPLERSASRASIKALALRTRSRAGGGRKARTPLIVLAADIPTGTLWSNFKVDQAALAATVGAIPSACAG